MTNKKKIAFYIRILALVLSAVGLITFVLSNTISPANSLGNSAVLTCYGALGIVCMFASLFLGNRGRGGEIAEAAAIMLAVSLLLITMVKQLGGRILLISGLFTWNSMNMEGWRVFYLMIASCVCLLVSDVIQIIGAFLKQ